MDLSNDTTYDARYKVAGGGTPFAPHDHSPAEVARWPVIRAGSIVRHLPNTPGPWTVIFYVNDHQVIVKASPDTDRINLVATRGAFRAQARKGPRSA